MPSFPRSLSPRKRGAGIHKFSHRLCRPVRTGNSGARFYRALPCLLQIMGGVPWHVGGLRLADETGLKSASAHLNLAAPPRGYALFSKTNPRSAVESTKAPKNEPETNLNEPKTTPRTTRASSRKSFAISSTLGGQRKNEPNRTRKRTQALCDWPLRFNSFLPCGLRVVPGPRRVPGSNSPVT
jgi:hypothetical protein